MNVQPITDKTVWNKFLEKYSPSSLFQTWEWGEVVEAISNIGLNPKNNLSRWGIFDDSELVGLAQVEIVRAKRGKFFHIRHGPIFSIINKNYFDDLITFLKEQATINHISFIRISPQIENSPQNKNFLKQAGFRPSPIHAMDGEYCWVLDLTKSEEEILREMRKTTRYLIKKAHKMGVKIVKSQDIGKFLNLYDRTAKRQKFIMHKGIREEFEIFKKYKQVNLYLAEYNKEILSGAIILYSNNQAIYHHGASVPSPIPASYLLQWEAITEAKKNGLSIYNFWGIAPPNKKRHPWRGHTLFKTGFGGKVVEYIHAQDLPLTRAYWITYIIELIRRVKKGY